MAAFKLETVLGQALCRNPGVEDFPGVEAFKELQASGFPDMTGLWHYTQEHTELLDWLPLDEFTEGWECMASNSDLQSVWRRRWLRAARTTSASAAVAQAGLALAAIPST